MMNRKQLITSVVLVLGYGVMCHVSKLESEKNEALTGLFWKILKDEKQSYEYLINANNEESKKKSTLHKLTQNVEREAEMILSIIENSEYKNTEYLYDLFTKFEIDKELLSQDFKSDNSRYHLYNSVNKYLSKHLEFISSHNKELTLIKLRLLNRRDTYEVDNLHRLDFQIYGNYLSGNAVKHYYEIEGDKKRIEDIPLILDHHPASIKFITEFTDAVTGEKRTFKSQLTP